MSKSLLVVAVVLTFWVASVCAQLIHVIESPNPEPNGYFGTSVSGIGDVSMDNHHDFIVGEPTQGKAYVFSGATGSVFHVLVSPGGNGTGGFGQSMSCAGDVNHDGFNDVIIGAPFEESNYGRAYLFSAAYGAPIRTLVSPGPSASSGRFGWSVSGAGDVNDDGYADIVVGAYMEWLQGNPIQAGRAYIFSGLTGEPLSSLFSPNEELQGYFGYSVSGVGDVNNDGFDDVIVGAQAEDAMGFVDGGRAYVFDGLTGDILYVLPSPAPQTSGEFGWSVSDAGDVDGDGVFDFVVGARGESRAHIFSGATRDVIHTLVSPNWEYEGYFGHSVSSAGDVNLDGYDDVIVGAYRVGPSPSPAHAGRAYIFSGLTGAPLCFLASPNEEEDGNFGYSVSGAGDVNNDGYDDVIVGANYEDCDSTNAGRAYVYSPLIQLSGDLLSDELQLQWSTCYGASEYWLYGTANETYFVPGLAPPHEYRLATIPFGTNTWADTSGVGDPDNNWAYMIIAVGSTGLEVYRSNRFGEWDFGWGIP